MKPQEAKSNNEARTAAPRSRGDITAVHQAFTHWRPHILPVESQLAPLDPFACRA